jgi:hypothetical protein
MSEMTPRRRSIRVNSHSKQNFGAEVNQSIYSIGAEAATAISPNRGVREYDSISDGPFRPQPDEDLDGRPFDWRILAFFQFKPQSVVEITDIMVTVT